MEKIPGKNRKKGLENEDLVRTIGSNKFRDRNQNRNGKNS